MQTTQTKEATVEVSLQTMRYYAKLPGEQLCIRTSPVHWFPVDDGSDLLIYMSSPLGRWFKENYVYKPQWKNGRKRIHNSTKGSDERISQRQIITEEYWLGPGAA